MAERRPDGDALVPPRATPSMSPELRCPSDEFGGNVVVTAAELKELLGSVLEERNTALKSALQHDMAQHFAQLLERLSRAPRLPTNGSGCQAYQPSMMSLSLPLSASASFPNPMGSPQQSGANPMGSRQSGCSSPRESNGLAGCSMIFLDTPEDGPLTTDELASPEGALTVTELHSDPAEPSAIAERMTKQKAMEQARSMAAVISKGWSQHISEACKDDGSKVQDSWFHLCTDRRRLRHLVDHPSFDIGVGSLIVINTLIMFFQLEYQGAQVGYALGARPEIGWKGADDVFFVAEHVFNFVFLLELLLRMWAYRWDYFKEAANYLDCFLVLTAAVDAYLLPLFAAGLDLNLSFGRLIRFGRMVRVFRLVRVMRVFCQLRVLVNTIWASFGTLLWSLVILGIVMLISALLLCQILDEYIMDETEPQEKRMWVYQRYGSAMRASYTMIEITLSGAWPTYARPLIEDVSPYYSIFFVVYVYLVVFAVVRIITALFLKETLKIASEDSEMMVAEQTRVKSTYVDRLTQIFAGLDVSGDGLISQQEFEAAMSDQSVKAWLAVLDLQVHEVSGLFALLDHGNGRISYEEFTSGIVRLKGPAQSVDVVTLLHENRKILRTIKRSEKNLAKVMSEMKRIVLPRELRALH